jgi:hypothetical protein
MKNRNLFLTASMFAAVLSMGARSGCLNSADRRRYRDIFTDPEPPAPKTARDLERIAAAEAKRARKAARRARR